MPDFEKANNDRPDFFATLVGQLPKDRRHAIPVSESPRVGLLSYSLDNTARGVYEGIDFCLCGQLAERASQHYSFI